MIACVHKLYVLMSSAYEQRYDLACQRGCLSVHVQNDICGTASFVFCHQTVERIYTHCRLVPITGMARSVKRWGDRMVQFSGRASDSDPKDEGSNPVGSTRNILGVFLSQKINVVLTHCRYICPTPVCTRTHRE